MLQCVLKAAAEAENHGQCDHEDIRLLGNYRKQFHGNCHFFINSYWVTL